MAYDFVLPVLSYPDPTPSEGLIRALDLAATLGGEVTALVHRADIPPIVNVLAEVLIDVSAMAAAAEAQSAEAAARLSAEFDTMARRLAIRATTVGLTSRLELAPGIIAAAARTHDIGLVVSDGTAATRDVAEALLFESGGPVVVFPVADAPVHLQSVVVAWDGGRAAARAVRDALPILKLARQVAILTVDDDKPDAAERVGALRRFFDVHAVNSRHLERRRGDVPIGRFIADTAQSQGAGLMVMGAYGHARLREFVLGGATRAMLEGVALPTLMSH